ncbi:acyltransferase family protein [Komagataeibacter medellinensis]|uniref:acyltransferase family protein n=1 Tax=Komagataeibacter medellinensis TaxID=1177712 RepID=UPI002B1E9C9F|nr:acyltransferase [Komagataeibacter medellinensis]
MLQIKDAALASTSSRWRDILEKDFFPQNRRRDIDGLRGLAIALVVLFHAGWLQGGFVGVDIFVVISGYFMGRSALMQHPFQPVRFVCRRLYRLLPALVCMIALVSAGMLWWVLQSDRADIAINGAYALVYLSNIWACRLFPGAEYCLPVPAYVVALAGNAVLYHHLPHGPAAAVDKTPQTCPDGHLCGFGSLLRAELFQG